MRSRPGSGRAPTLDEVAALAGVSRSVASRAINNEQYVSKAKRDAVQKAIRELGYTPNQTARALVRNQVGAVVLAVGTEWPGLFADPFFAEVLVGVTSVLSRTDLELKLVLEHHDPSDGRPRQLRLPHADGFMLMSLQGEDPMQALAEKRGVPVVYGGRPITGDPTYFVDADNRSGARAATEHLIRTGHTRIATVSGPLDTHVGAARHGGFLDALALAGLTPAGVEHGDFSGDAGEQATARLIESGADFDALFVASDTMAAGALQALKRAGRSVPGDVALVGFDDQPLAQHTEPALTTVHQPIRGLGQEMARMLVAAIAGDEPQPVLLPTRLVVRASAP